MATVPMHLQVSQGRPKDPRELWSTDISQEFRLSPTVRSSLDSKNLNAGLATKDMIQLSHITTHSQLLPFMLSMCKEQPHMSPTFSVQITLNPKR